MFSYNFLSKKENVKIIKLLSPEHLFKIGEKLSRGFKFYKQIGNHKTKEAFIITKGLADHLLPVETGELD